MSEFCPGCGKKGKFHSDMQGGSNEPTYILCVNSKCDVSEYETGKKYTEFENITKH